MRRAFSLIETLVVLAIVTVLFLLAVPAYEQMAKGSRVAIGGSNIIDQLNLAQQTALSRNAPVEVRFYKLSDPTRPGTESYRALQIFLCHEAIPRPFGKVVLLPPGISLVADASKTSLFQEKDGPLIDPLEKPGDIEIPPFGLDYRYVAFRFRSNGETDMTGRPAFLTIASPNDPMGPNGIPTNFITIQIDPITGRTRSFRP